MTMKRKKHRQSCDYQCFLSVGVTGFEPATTRPPDAYSNRAELHPAAQLRCKSRTFYLTAQLFAIFFRILRIKLLLLSGIEDKTDGNIPEYPQESRNHHNAAYLEEHQQPRTADTGLVSGAAIRHSTPCHM